MAGYYAYTSKHINIKAIGRISLRLFGVYLVPKCLHRSATAALPLIEMPRLHQIVAAIQHFTAFWLQPSLDVVYTTIVLMVAAYYAYITKMVMAIAYYAFGTMFRKDSQDNMANFDYRTFACFFEANFILTCDRKVLCIATLGVVSALLVDYIQHITLSLLKIIPLTKLKERLHSRYVYLWQWCLAGLAWLQLFVFPALQQSNAY